MKQVMENHVEKNCQWDVWGEGRR